MRASVERVKPKWARDLPGYGTILSCHCFSLEECGDYANAEAHAGIVRSSAAQVVTKGPVSLALAGRGEGIDLGVEFGVVKDKIDVKSMIKAY